MATLPVPPKRSAFGRTQLGTQLIWPLTRATQVRTILSVMSPLDLTKSVYVPLVDIFPARECALIRKPGKVNSLSVDSPPRLFLQAVWETIYAASSTHVLPSRRPNLHLWLLLPLLQPSFPR